MSYLITHWCDVPAKFFSEERIKEVIDCGINLVMGAYDVEMNRKALEYCEKYGVKYMLYDSRIHLAMHNPESMDEYISAVCADYKDYPALHSYHITDEPGADKFPLLGKIVETFRKYDPDHVAYINLFPNYANEQQLGTPTYDEHLRQYMDIVKPELLSYDHYHLLTPNRPENPVDIDDPREAGIYAAAQQRVERAGFYDNIEAIRSYGLEYDVPYMLIILLTEHGPYRYLRREEISYEIWQTLAYGCTLLSYFTYWTPGDDPVWHFRNGIISADGEKCQHYWDVQALNKIITPVGEKIAATKSAAVFHVGEEKENVQFFAGYGKIRSITGGSLTVGFFEDGSMILANKDFDNGADVTIDTDAELLLFDGKDYIPCGKTVKLEAGGGALLMIK